MRVPGQCASMLVTLALMGACSSEADVGTGAYELAPRPSADRFALELGDGDWAGWSHAVDFPAEGEARFRATLSASGYRQLGLALTRSTSFNKNRGFRKVTMAAPPGSNWAMQGAGVGVKRLELPGLDAGMRADAGEIGLWLGADSLRQVDPEALPALVEGETTSPTQFRFRLDGLERETRTVTRLEAVDVEAAENGDMEVANLVFVLPRRELAPFIDWLDATRAGTAGSREKTGRLEYLGPDGTVLLGFSLDKVVIKEIRPRPSHTPVQFPEAYVVVGTFVTGSQGTL